MEARELFKKLVKDAREPNREALPVKIMSWGSQRFSDFEVGKKNSGRFAYLTDAHIDSLSDIDLECEMVTFIYKCFQQR